MSSSFGQSVEESVAKFCDGFSFADIMDELISRGVVLSEDHHKSFAPGSRLRYHLKRLGYKCTPPNSSGKYYANDLMVAKNRKKGEQLAELRELSQGILDNVPLPDYYRKHLKKALQESSAPMPDIKTIGSATLKVRSVQKLSPPDTGEQ